MAPTRTAGRSAIASRTRTHLLRRIAHLACALVLAASPAFAQEAKSLDWTAFTVDARLDSTGTLVVREKQTILFNGDWNGGERRFDVRQGQRFTFRRLLRVDSLTGAEVPMREGSLDEVDGYRMTEGRTLRWRSRLPTGPVFLNTKITYVLEYEYADILVAEGAGYRLDHEFGFRDRTGTIANFDLKLQVDQAWRTPATFTGTFHQQVLEPGLGYVVNIPLTWRGAGVPSAVRRSPPQPLRLGLAAAVLLAIVVMTAMFLRDERQSGGSRHSRRTAASTVRGSSAISFRSRLSWRATPGTTTSERRRCPPSSRDWSTKRSSPVGWNPRAGRFLAATCSISNCSCHATRSRDMSGR